ncbi:MAG: prolyl oligopeptidase family serine peptidase [Muribaculaceae bacterium]|nr:prolyl oligopeptidase family serine peptidase [Muribaculaceae bacterium]
MKKFLLLGGILSIVLATGCSTKGERITQTETKTQQPSMGGPKLGGPGMGGGQRPTPSPELQALIDETVPSFKQYVFVNEKGDSLQYNLFTPKNLEAGKKYPLVLFMADASTPGPDPLTPLTQGYGGLVWAAPEFQAKHPAFVLVPQYSYVTVDNEWQTMPEVDETIELLNSLTGNYPVDTDRLYTTGQSMGGMMSLYFNIKYPDLFAASMFVSCQWDVAKMSGFKNKKFVYITAGGDKEATGGATQLKALLKKENAPFAEATWSARLPEAEQDSLATALLNEGKPRNFITFEGNTVLPKDGKGMVHMASFNFAYRLSPVCEWIFQQSK